MYMIHVDSSNKSIEPIYSIGKEKGNLLEKIGDESSLMGRV
jgi:hypothetical protein